MSDRQDGRGSVFVGQQGADDGSIEFIALASRGPCAKRAGAGIDVSRATRSLEGRCPLSSSPASAHDGASNLTPFDPVAVWWLDQRRMSELFGVDVRTVSEHLRNVYDSGELAEEATLRKIRRVRTEGNREVAREVSY